MTNDRQSILQALVEGALRAAADPSVTAVLRSWDWYEPRTASQPLMPFLVVSVTDDEELAIDAGLYMAQVSVSPVVDWAPSVRDAFDSIRGSVRSVMHALPGLSAAGLTIDGVRETSCSEPEIVSSQGDVMSMQIISFSVWFSAPVTPDAVIAPDLYLVDRAEDGCTYTTTQAADPRRIARWSGQLAVSYGFGAWADRASLQYTAPVTPLSTSVPPTVLTTQP